MTTPINTFEDILDALERDPALRDTLRRHILTDEFLQMPLRLEQLVTDQKDFNSNTLTRLDRMEKDSTPSRDTAQETQQSPTPRVSPTTWGWNSSGP